MEDTARRAAEAGATDDVQPVAPPPAEHLTVGKCAGARRRGADRRGMRKPRKPVHKLSPHPYNRSPQKNSVSVNAKKGRVYVDMDALLASYGLLDDWGAAQGADVDNSTTTSVQQCLDILFRGNNTFARFAGIGVSVVDDAPKELVYLAVWDAVVVCRGDDKNGLVELEVKVVGVQADNSQDVAHYPSILRLATREEKNGAIRRMKLRLQRRLKGPGGGRDADLQKHGSASFLEIFAVFRTPPAKALKNIVIRQCSAVVHPLTIHLEVDAMFSFFSYVLRIAEVHGSYLSAYLDRNVAQVQQSSMGDVSTTGHKRLIRAPVPSRAPAGYVGVYAEDVSISEIVLRISTRASRGTFAEAGNGLVARNVEFVGSAITDLTDLRIKYAPLHYSFTFKSVLEYRRQFVAFYMQQTLLQTGRLLGRLDLIGNPAGLVSNIASGLHTLVKRPTESIRNGPAEFFVGFGRGIGGCLAAIVGGIFDSLSKISGSAIKVLELTRLVDSGDLLRLWPAPVRVTRLEVEQPSNFIIGTLKGLQGSLQGIGSSIAAIGLEPVRSVKKHGPWKGVFRGSLRGICAAVLGIVSSALMLVQGISSGFRNSLLTKKLPEAAIRPRRLFLTNSVPPYNPDAGTALRKWMALFKTPPASSMPIQCLTYAAFVRHSATVSVRQEGGAQSHIFEFPSMFVAVSEDKQLMLAAFEKASILSVSLLARDLTVLLKSDTGEAPAAATHYGGLNQQHYIKVDLPGLDCDIEPQEPNSSRSVVTPAAERRRKRKSANGHAPADGATATGGAAQQVEDRLVRGRGAAGGVRAAVMRMRTRMQRRTRKELLPKTEGRKQLLLPVAHLPVAIRMFDCIAVAATSRLRGGDATTAGPEADGSIHDSAERSNHCPGAK
eukprot:GHVU01038742.1.p1 GENE.GHVU01038742.1~~GHVU01038742.1.p1  ORF type:complete len:987 (+),score=114.93 GHVU01038742.1:300-2963(+)